MKCPNCSGRNLSIRVAFTGLVSCRFREEGDRRDQEVFELTDDVHLDSEWKDHSECRCQNCRWHGRVREARAAVGVGVAAVPADSSAAADTGSASHAAVGVALDDIRKELLIVGCEAHWQERIEELMCEVERLNSLLELVSRANKLDKNSSGSDTVLG